MQALWERVYPRKGQYRLARAHKKTRHMWRVFLQLPELLRTNLRSLHALLAALGDEGNSLAFFQALEAVGFDGFEVYEQVVAAACWGDEAVAFFIIEPFDGALLAIGHEVNLQNI